MKKLTHRQIKILKISGVILLAAVCLFSLWWFVFNVKKDYQTGELQPTYTREGTTRVYHPITVNSIRSWMTFDYLNVVFKLPKNYLQNVLDITDPRYPNMRIDYYVKRHGLSSSAFVQAVQVAIINYQQNTH